MILPAVNACLNGLSLLLLLTGFFFIRRKNIAAHKKCMLAALGVSSVFLVCYLVHHAQVGSVAFRHTGWLRSVYFVILVPHVVLAAAVVPMALVTITRGLKLQVEQHRRLARVTLPVWLFVSMSGIVVYLMLYQM
jgi:putative membrane protein